MSDNKTIVKPDLKSEMDELQRVVQDLSRDENIETTVKELVNAFNDSTEEPISNEVWSKLENTESNDIDKGDMKAVYGIAKKYKKTNPQKLAQSFADGDYKRPLIVQFGDRYHLVAGNTRLCTAAALGIKPNVFIAKINNMDNLEEGCWKGYKQIGGKIKNGKNVPNCVPKNESQGETNEASSSAQQAAIAINMKKKGVEPKKKETKESMGADASGSFEGQTFGSTILKRDLYKPKNTKKYNIKEEEEFQEATDASSSGSYDVPLFGKTPKGRRDPLKIDGEKSIKQSRAVKDKNFPKWGGPDSVFIKVKDKCKKFPYCNQGDINAIEMLEMEELTQAITEIANEMKVPFKEIEKIVLNEIKLIFI